MNHAMATLAPGVILGIAGPTVRAEPSAGAPDIIVVFFDANSLSVWRHFGSLWAAKPAAQAGLRAAMRRRW
jgi:hypothetical protein